MRNEVDESAWAIHRIYTAPRHADSILAIALPSGEEEAVQWKCENEQGCCRGGPYQR